MYILRRNKTTLFLVTMAFSSISLIMLITSLISKQTLPIEMYLFIASSILYSIIVTFAYYWAYSQSTSISPKEFNKVLRVYRKNKELKMVLEQLDKKNGKVSTDKAIDKAVQILKSYNN